MEIFCALDVFNQSKLSKWILWTPKENIDIRSENGYARLWATKMKYVGENIKFSTFVYYLINIHESIWKMIFP